MQKVEKRFDYNKKTDLNAKINATDNSFSILTDEIIEVSTDSTVAYTFRIETPTQEASDFENFVISRFYDNDYQFYIYRYKEPELIEEDDDYLIVSREQVNEDQINIGDFNEFISNKMFYDTESECLLDIKSLGGILYIDILFCDILMEGGGIASAGGGSIINGAIPNGTNAYLYDCSEPYSINGDGVCHINCKLINDEGSLLYNDTNIPLQYVVEIPCNDNNASNNDYNTGSGSNSTGSGTGNTSNDDTNTNEAGGSGGSSSDGSTSNPNDSADTVGVLPDWYTPEFIIDYYGITDQEEVGMLNNCNSDSYSGCDFCEDLGKYLRRERYSPEATAFGEQAYQAFLNGVELSFEEIIIALEYELDYRNRMSTSELTIFNSISRIKQLGYLFNGQKATWEAASLFPNSRWNGKGDAFRHAYFNGLNAILLGESLAESLATAHEEKPFTYAYQFKEKQMDLFNNEIGRDKKDWFIDGYNSLIESILDAMSNGELRYLSNLLGGNESGEATNDSQLIPTS